MKCDGQRMWAIVTQIRLAADHRGFLQETGVFRGAPRRAGVLSGAALGHAGLPRLALQAHALRPAVLATEDRVAEQRIELGV